MPRSRQEAIAAGVNVAETKHNMKRRTPWHDYRQKGIYMLTVVVEGRQPLLGRLKVNNAEPAENIGSGENALMQVTATVEPTALGRVILAEETAKISAVYPQLEVWKVCLMPDHIHIIVCVKENLPPGKHLGHIVAGFKGGCSRAWWRSLYASPTLSPCAETQGTLSSASSAPVPPASAGGPRPSLFERGYNDKILLESGQLDNWKHYLDDNPRRLAVKRLHPDLFVTTRYMDIGEWHCQMVGNRFLLDVPQKVAVIVHRAYGDAEFARYKELWLACGEAGGVLVSAAVAPREKEVMREAMERGYRLILVRENGFPPLYKPSGEAFDACSEGRLLQISPWEHHMQRRTISREQCLKLNRLVETIQMR